MTSSRTDGFTLVELMIVIVVSIPILLAIVTTSERAGHAVNTTERVAEAAEVARTTSDRIGQMIRSASWATFRVQATAADVTAGLATSVGDWMPALENDPRSGIQFRSASGELIASGTLAMNAADLTTPRELELVRDVAESVNGIDDDGDGLVDEGQLFFGFDTTRVAIADGIEACTFELDGGVVRFVLRCGRRDAGQRVHRVTAQHVWAIRNQ